MGMTKQEFMAAFEADKARRDKQTDAAVIQKRRRINWTAEMVNDIKKLHGEGLTYAEIAERIGVELTALKSKIARLGLHRGRKKSDTGSDTADEIYIHQLEELLKMRTSELENAQKEIADKKYTDKIGDSPDNTALEKIYAMLDCLRAINPENLESIDSAKHIICNTLEIIRDEIQRRSYAKGSV